MIDTCQAASMYEKFYSPNILAVASSLVGEDSLSVRGDRLNSVTLTYFFLDYDLFSITSTPPSVSTSSIVTRSLRWNSWRKSTPILDEQWANSYVNTILSLFLCHLSRRPRSFLPQFQQVSS